MLMLNRAEDRALATGTFIRIPVVSPRNVSMIETSVVGMCTPSAQTSPAAQALQAVVVENYGFAPSAPNAVAIRRGQAFASAPVSGDRDAAAASKQAHRDVEGVVRLTAAGTWASVPRRESVVT